MVNARLCVFSFFFVLCTYSRPSRGQDMAKLAEIVHSFPELDARIFSGAGFDIGWLSHVITNEVDLLSSARNSLQRLATNNCTGAWMKLWNVTDEFSIPVIIRMLDAFGKPGAGYLDGNIYAYGSFDECLDTGYAQYCLFPLNLTANNHTIFFLNTGACIPSECRPKDITEAVDVLNAFLQNLKLKLQVQSVLCQAERHAPYHTGAIVMIIVSCVFILMVLFATFVDFLNSVYAKERYHYTTIQAEEAERERDGSLAERLPLLVHTKDSVSKADRGSNENKFLALVTAFSLYKTLPTILATEQPPSAITSINGLRVISMFWVILGHNYVWTLQGSEAMDNILWVLRNVLPTFTFQAIMNATVSVDSFFFLSGLLVAYLTLRQMGRKKHWKVFALYYVHRIIRLTPTYAFVLFFNWFMSVHLANSPAYIQASSPGGAYYENCRYYWWTNLLYINNLYPWNIKSECMPWMWYVANDMQFFIVAPLMVILLYWSVPFGLISVAIFFVGTFAATGAIAGYYQYDVNVFDTVNRTMLIPQLPQADTSMDELYIKPYARISPYLVGIVLGFILYRKLQIPFNRVINMAVYALIWVLAAFFCVSTLYGLYGTWHGDPFTAAENIVYFMFSRCAWAVGLALLVFACHNGYGGVVDRFLSMKFWIPLSRLTFGAYLVHPIVLSAVYSADVAPIHYNHVTFSVFAIGTIVLSYAVAGALAVFVEFPISNLEMVVFKLLGIQGRESTRHYTKAQSSNAKTL